MVSPSNKPAAREHAQQPPESREFAQHESATREPVTSATAARVLEVAERLAQTRGFNGFSYADIAAELHVTKASLHYHFATKGDLGRALIASYTERFIDALGHLGHLAADPQDRLRSYAKLYEDVLVRDRMCLCGMLAAEYSTLPPPMKRALREFFDKNESWLAQNLESGRSDGALSFEGSSLEAARALAAGLEGAMLLARSYEEPARFRQAAKLLLASLGVPQAAAAAKERAGTQSDRRSQRPRSRRGR